MKIHIIGCSGSGKTYLARALSKKYNISHYDLDDIQWDNNSQGYGVKMPLEKRNALLQEIKSLCNLLKWTNTFQTKNLTEIKYILEKYENKVIWLSSSREVNRIITD